LGRIKLTCLGGTGQRNDKAALNATPHMRAKPASKRPCRLTRNCGAQNDTAGNLAPQIET
jgi:thiamine pyrophosphokinase